MANQPATHSYGHNKGIKFTLKDSIDQMQKAYIQHKNKDNQQKFDQEQFRVLFAKMGLNYELDVP